MGAIDDLAAELSKLPGIGRKTALRLTYHLLKQSPDQSKRLATALTTLAEKVRPCPRCFNLTEEDLCSICRDVRRDTGVICAVEEASDIGAIERSGEYRGVYHVLGGRLSPLDGIGPHRRLDGHPRLPLDLCRQTYSGHAGENVPRCSEITEVEAQDLGLHPASPFHSWKPECLLESSAK